jgi:hypothetical protein
MLQTLLRDRIFSMPGSLDRILLHDDTVHLLHGEWAEPLLTEALPGDDGCTIYTTTNHVLRVFPRDHDLPCWWNNLQLSEVNSDRFMFLNHRYGGYLVKRKKPSHA